MTHEHDSLSTREQTSALQGIRVIEFGHYIAGPLAGMLLADQGAEVIKVERPGGDPARAYAAFATWNRGKRSVQLDLKSPDGQAQAQALVRAADVVIESFRPGVAARPGRPRRPRRDPGDDPRRGAPAAPREAPVERQRRETRSKDGVY